MENQLFLNNDYRQYLRVIADSKPQRSGFRMALAKAMNCSPAYLSQILKGDREISLEQGEMANRFLGHGADEAHFFLLLVQFQRAGTQELRRYFDHQITDLRKKRTHLSVRLKKSEELSEKDKEQYYSSWHYAAVHVAVTLADFNTHEKIAQKLQLPLPKVKAIIDFLQSTHLIKWEKKRFFMGKSHIHLSKESPHILKHYINWRMKALNDLAEKFQDNVSYSGVMTCSSEDLERIREIMVKAIEDSTNKAVQSKAESEIVYFNLDLFSV